MPSTNTSSPAGSLSSRFARTWLLTALSDGLFSSILAAFFYGSTVARLWQGVAAVLMGPSAMDGGMRTVAIGLLMHLGVAFAWTAVFFVVYAQVEFVRRVANSPMGVLKIAVVYGPIIWMVMSLLVIPALVHKPTTITYKWWVQFFGHMVFVAAPIVYLGRRTQR